MNNEYDANVALLYIFCFMVDWFEGGNVLCLFGGENLLDKDRYIHNR